MKSFSTREVADLLDMSVEEVRDNARAGYLHPGRGPNNTYRFSFQDLVLLRTAKALAGARVSPRRLRRALRRLTRQLPGGRPLSEVRITAEGDRVVVRDGDSAWMPDSGQLVLDFNVADLAHRVAPLARRRVDAARQAQPELTADQWYELACDLEAAAPQEARDAYRRALELEPRHADAHVNLGRLLQEAGAIVAASEHYRAALTYEPAHATAAFNLGVALEDLGRRVEAAEAYKAALAADPDLADAHYNLAGVYERLGKRTAALRHLNAYRRMVG